MKNRPDGGPSSKTWSYSMMMMMMMNVNNNIGSKGEKIVFIYCVEVRRQRLVVQEKGRLMIPFNVI
jgi:hypothetical protein